MDGKRLYGSLSVGSWGGSMVEHNHDDRYYDKVTVDTKIANAGSGGSVDLSNYYTKTEVDTKDNLKVDKVSGKSLLSDSEITRLAGLSNYTHPSTHSASIIIQDSSNRFVSDTEKNTWNNKSNFDGNYNSLTNKPAIPTVDVTKSYVDGELAKKLNSAGHVLTDNNYTTAEKSKLASLSNADVTKSYVDTELTKKAPTVHTHTKSQIIDLPTDLASESFVTNKIAEAQLGGGEVDLTGYATKDELSVKVDKVVGKSLIADTEITRLASVTNYIHPANHPASIITQDSSNRFVSDTEKNTWNAKSNFDGNYNNLTNKPVIPTVDVTKSYVDNALLNKVDKTSVTTKTISNNILSLDTTPFQVVDMVTGTTINLPTVSTFTEIRLVFSCSADLTLTFPSIKWQNTPEAKLGKTYEYCFTWVNATIGYIGGWISYA